MACGDLDRDTSDALESEHADLDDRVRATRFDRRAFYELAAHIEQEETELFPSAMFAFDEDDWEVLTDVRSDLASPSGSRTQPR